MGVGRVEFLSLLCFWFQVTSNVKGAYVITSSRTWTKGWNSKVCITLTEPPTVNDNVQLTLTNGDEVLVPLTPLKINADGHNCQGIVVPLNSSDSATLSITGTLGGKPVDESEEIRLVLPRYTTFVETDKYLYQASQDVNFRVLSVGGPFLKVSTEAYPLIWIENPKGARIKQWLDLNNTRGLIHLRYTLTDEPTQGVYRIKVRNFEGATFETEFKVEEYTLPRFEVTILPPKYLLGIDDFVTFDVCSQYTFGQPVKGLVKVTIDTSSRWRHVVPTYINHQQIDGCLKYNVSLTEVVDTPNGISEVSNLNIAAEVTEEGTDVTLKASSVTVGVEREALSFEDLSLQKSFKPPLPYVAELLATLPDGTPSINNQMKVCVGDICKLFSTDSRGLLKFAIPTHLKGRLEVKSLRYPDIKVNGTDYSYRMYQSKFSKNLESYYSPSNSSLTIGLEDRELKCNPGLKDIEFELPLRYSSGGTQASARFTVQVVSRGSIQHSESITQQFDSSTQGLGIEDELFLEPPRGSPIGTKVGHFTIRVKVPRTISPNAKILAWFVRDDGEIVSDTVGISVTKCLLNDVSLGWSTQEARPGDPETLSLSAAPNSLCSIGIVDKSVALLSSENQKPISVDRVLELTSSYNSQYGSSFNEWEYCERVLKESEEESVMGPETTTLPHWMYETYFSDDIDAFDMFEEAGIFIISDQEAIFRRCQKKYENMVYYSFAGGHGGGGIMPTASGLEDSVRTYFPETWIWSLVDISENGTLEQDLTLPDTVTEWLGRAVCVHPEEGIGISETASITTFRDFFVDLTLPPSAKRGEVFPVKISVFNYLDEPLPVKLTMQKSDQFEILPEHPGMLVSGVRSSCILPQDKVVHSVTIRPMDTGDLNITVEAVVDVDAIANCSNNTLLKRRDALIKPIRVDFEGFPKEKVWTEYFCPNDKDGVSSAHWSLMTPPDIVEDSGRGFVSVVGDMMGPTIDNLGHLVRLPTGCGEQNMIGFAPNIFVMQYLEFSRQSNPEISSKATSYMEAGYKRELNYRHQDGSYSAFGESDASGSTWLTSFVVKCFAQARPYVEVDDSELSLSTSWLKSLQGKDGCFSSVGTVLHKEMKGGLGNSQSPDLLSSFVLISLLESGEDPFSEEIKQGVRCLQSSSSSATYALAVKAYALALARAPSANNALKELLAKEIVPGQSSDAVAVETAGYAILALLTIDPLRYKKDVKNLIDFINNKRNGQGGFVSTQDTIVALQALAAYEKAFPPSDVNAKVEIDMNGSKETFSVTERNKILLQTSQLPSVPTDVKVHVTGNGCVLGQAVLRYNVPKPDASEAFTLRVEATTEPSKGCKTKRIKVCASYQLLDLKSNMAIIETDIMTGYIPDKADLKQVVGYGTGLFKRYEVDGSKVLFYIDEFSHEEICASFKVLREFEVEDAKNGTVSVYDYYSPQYSISQSYRLPPPDECVVLPPLPPFIDEIVDARPVVPIGPNGPPF